MASCEILVVLRFVYNQIILVNLGQLYTMVEGCDMELGGPL